MKQASKVKLNVDIIIIISYCRRKRIGGSAKSDGRHAVGITKCCGIIQRFLVLVVDAFVVIKVELVVLLVARLLRN